jgi:hypothetical protein
METLKHGRESKDLSKYLESNGHSVFHASSSGCDSTTIAGSFNIAFRKYWQLIISLVIPLEFDATWKSPLYAALPISSIAASRRDFLAHIRAG